MATEAAAASIAHSNLNGSGTGPHHLSPAEALKQKHEADLVHRASIEDVEDEEDIKRPATHDITPGPVLEEKDTVDGSTGSWAQPMSAKAAGKQKARDEAIPENAKLKQANQPLDLKSDDAFPSLGGGSKTSAAASSSAWGAKKTNGALKSNGAAGSSSHSSRASTPASGVVTPTSAPAVASVNRNQTGPSLTLPGRQKEVSDTIVLKAHELLPRDQLKKPVSEILQAIKKSTGANLQMSTSRSGESTFFARGTPEGVRKALRDIAKQLSAKQSTKVTIPASLRHRIIGNKQGATIQGIQQRSGTRVHVPRPDESISAHDEDGESMIDVSIEGDALGVKIAKDEILTIVNEHTSNVSLSMKSIPAEFYPFIAGPNNARTATLEEAKNVRIQVPHYHTWTSQPPPPVPSPNESPAFRPAPGNPIRISGDRLAAQQAREEIERWAEQLSRQITLSELAINRGQHRFIVGEKGSSLHDFLEETGCAVILPPPSEDTENLTITGPQERINDGINKVLELASSMQSSVVDISRQHPSGAQTHARNLTRYLQQRKEIERLEKTFDAHIALPRQNEGQVAWEIYSRNGRNTILARSEIISIVNAHPPAKLSQVEIDPFFHNHVRQQSAHYVRDKYGVHLVFPEQHEENPQVLLVYEGEALPGQTYELPKKQPSPAETTKAKQALQEAREHLLGLIQAQRDITTKSVDVPKKFHEKVQKFASREQQNLAAGELPVRVQIGESVPRTSSTPDDKFFLRGPTDSVDNLIDKINWFIEEEKENEKENGYTTSFDFPQKFANMLIGKKGENIRKYREEFDVEIQVNDGKVDIKGAKRRADAAKAKIVALGKKLEDEATHVLKIKPQYHRDLIGAKGSQVNRLQERYNVRVNFPRSANAGGTGDDHSIGDTASEAGGQRYSRAPQAPDEVIIRGPRKGADEAREELLNLLQWTIDNSYSASVSVASNQVPSLIGQGGREMDSLRMTTGAQIDVPDFKRDGPDSTKRVEIKVKGTKKQVEDAKKLLEERAKAFDESVVRTLEVDKKHHKALIGGGGAGIRDIVLKAGGSDDRRDLARMVRFPRQESDENVIRVEGNKAVVDKIVASIEEIVKQRESQVTETVEVAPEKHRMLIGRGGETRRDLESKFKVNIDVPKQSVTGHARSGVKITGLPEDVEKCKEHILEMVKSQDGLTINVPRRLHNAISDNGQFFRRLRNDHKVSVDHGGHQPPARSVASNPRARVNGGSLPLITDDQDSTESFSWELIDTNDESTEEGEIPWILRGPTENVAKAQKLIESALEQAQKQSATGYLILPDPSKYRYVVGPGGSQVNSIRKQTGCKIIVPRDQTKGEAIEIQGDKVGVEQAKDIILELVRNGGSGGNASSAGSGAGRGGRRGQT